MKSVSQSETVVVADRPTGSCHMVVLGRELINQLELPDEKLSEHFA